MNQIVRIAFTWGLIYLTVPASAQSQSQEGALPANTIDQIKQLHAAKSALSAADRKIDTQLLDALPNVAQRPGASIRTSVPTDTTGRVEVDITADVSPTLLHKIEELGGIVVSSFPRDHAIRAKLANNQLRVLAADPAVKAIQPAEYPRTNGVTAFEGDIAHQADVARIRFGVDGSGVKVCVISDSYDTNPSGALDDAYRLKALDRNNTSDLPLEGGFTVRHRSGEGLAMMEIVHQLAPGAVLEFSTAGGSEAQMAQNIRDLAASRCQVIVDDIDFLRELPFEDGPIAQAVNEVTADGIFYLTAATNYGSFDNGNSSTYEGMFVDGGAFTDASSTRPAGSVNAFKPGVNYDAVKTQSEDDSETISLFWNDPWFNKQNQYDLYVSDSSGKIFAEATFSSLPVQTIDLDKVVGHKKLRVDDRIIIVKEAGSADAFLHLDVTPRVKLDIGSNGRIRGHNAVATAFSIGAVEVRNPSIPFTPNFGVASFSSDGPRRMYFDRYGNQLAQGGLGATGGVLLNKPDFGAASGGNTTVPDFQPFDGTSAAAPHAAAIVALLLSRFPTLSIAQVHDILVKSALPNGATPWNNRGGYGTIMATRALAEAANRFPARIDNTFAANVDGAVFAIQRQPDGKILIGGRFSKVNGQNHQGLARIFPDGRLDTSFAGTAVPTANNGVIFHAPTAVLSGGKILVGGEFTQVNGQSLQGLAMLNANGSLDNSFNARIDGQVLAMAVQKDGRVLIAGSFTHVYGQPKKYVARLNADGSLDSAFTSTWDRAVNALAVAPDETAIFALTTIIREGYPAYLIVRLKTDGTLDRQFASLRTNVFGLTVQSNGDPVVGGDFGIRNGPGDIARFNRGDGSVDMNFKPGVGNIVWTLAAQSYGRLLVGGVFNRSIARLNLDGTTDLSFAITSDTPNPGQFSVFAISAADDGSVLIGGDFQHLDGQAKPYLARISAP